MSHQVQVQDQVKNSRNVTVGTTFYSRSFAFVPALIFLACASVCIAQDQPIQEEKAIADIRAYLGATPFQRSLVKETSLAQGLAKLSFEDRFGFELELSAAKPSGDLKSLLGDAHLEAMGRIFHPGFEMSLSVLRVRKDVLAHGLGGKLDPAAASALEQMALELNRADFTALERSLLNDYFNYPEARPAIKAFFESIRPGIVRQLDKDDHASLEFGKTVGNWSIYGFSAYVVGKWITAEVKGVRERARARKAGTEVSPPKKEESAAKPAVSGNCAMRIAKSVGRGLWGGLKIFSLAIGSGTVGWGGHELFTMARDPGSRGDPILDLKVVDQVLIAKAIVEATNLANELKSKSSLSEEQFKTYSERFAKILGEVESLGSKELNQPLWDYKTTVVVDADGRQMDLLDHLGEALDSQVVDIKGIKRGKLVISAETLKQRLQENQTELRRLKTK